MNRSRLHSLSPVPITLLLIPLALAACMPESAVHADRKEVEAGGAPREGVLAVVNGVDLTQAQVEEQVRSQLIGLEQQRRELLEQGLEQLISSRLFEAEAGSRGITPEQLREQMTAQVPAPTDEEVDAFYEERKDQINQPKEQIAGRIRDYLRQVRGQEREQEFLAELREKYGVQTFLEPYRIAVEEGDSPSLGPAGAPVTIIEFSDFECPYCSRLVPTLERVKEVYADKIRLVFRQFPLHSIHPNAQKAAEASLCAHEQGRFWEMHDTLFKEQRALSVEQLKQKAARLELDTEAFNSCLDSDRFAAKVEEDLKAGMAVGVQGTPAIFVNGRFLNGAQPFEVLSKVIDEELAAGGS